MDEIAKASVKSGVETKLAQKVKESEDSGDAAGAVIEITENKEALRLLDTGAVNVLGGTAWLWADADFARPVDVLFVDEAGQMPLANVLAVAQAAGSIVLLGDPQHASVSL